MHQTNKLHRGLSMDFEKAWKRRIAIAKEADVDCANCFPHEKLLYVTDKDFSVDRDLTRQHEALCNCR